MQSARSYLNVKHCLTFFAHKMHPSVTTIYQLFTEMVHSLFGTCRLNRFQYADADADANY